MNNNVSTGGVKSSKEGSKPRQKVKFEGENDEEKTEGSEERGVKGWLYGDYKVGGINFAIARVTEDRQVKTRTSWDASALFVSSEGALIAIVPYDYPAHPLFEHTPVLNNNFEH